MSGFRKEEKEYKEISMNRREFVEAYAKKYHRTKTLSKAVCKEIFEFLHECIVENERIYLKGLGTFKRKIQKQRPRYDFKTKQIVDACEVEKLVFVLSPDNEEASDIEDDE